MTPLERPRLPTRVVASQPGPQALRGRASRLSGLQPFSPPPHLLCRGTVAQVQTYVSGRLAALWLARPPAPPGLGWAEVPERMKPFCTSSKSPEPLPEGGHVTGAHPGRPVETTHARHSPGSTSGGQGDVSPLTCAQRSSAPSPAPLPGASDAVGGLLCVCSRSPADSTASWRHLRPLATRCQCALGTVIGCRPPTSRLKP